MLVTLEGYNAAKFTKQLKKVGRSPITKMIDALVTPAAAPKKAAPIKAAPIKAAPIKAVTPTPEKILQVENVVLTASFLSDADKIAYLNRLEELKKSIIGVVPKQIKATFTTGAGGKADYLYSLEKALAGLSGEINLGFGVKSLKKAVKKAPAIVQKAKAIKSAAKPLTTIGNKVLNNPAVKAAAMSNPYTAAGMTAYQGYRAIKETYSKGKDIKASIDETKAQINASADAKQAIIKAAADKAGVPIPETGLDEQSIAQMPAGDRAALANAMQTTQAEVIIKTEAQKEENAVDRIKRQDAEKQAAINKTFTAPIDDKKFTAEEIKEFNAGRGSYAERLAAQGKLLGEELLEFWNVEPYSGQLHQVALLIYGSPRYPEMPYPSVEYVEKILAAYLSTGLKLSIAQNSNLYYNGTTAAEQKEALGNQFIKIIYMQMKGLSTPAAVQANIKEFDYNLRDMIWIILAQLKTLAAAPEYKKFLQPFDFIKKSKSEVKANLTASDDNKKPLLIAGAALLALMVLKKGK